MSTYDVGDQALLRHEVRVAGELTAATVSLAVTMPDGTAVTPAPTVSTSSTGIYTASVSVTQAGPWTYTWTMSGAVVGQDSGSFSAKSPATPVYATVPQVKSYLQLEIATTDVQIADCLGTASRAVDKLCNRRFYADLIATARTYPATDSYCADVDDFWTTTGLVVKADHDGDGTFETTLAAANYDLRPANGIVDGESGWPYNEIRAVNTTFPGQRQRDGLQMTAKWGWAAWPAAVNTATVIITAETLKLAREAPFGVAGYGAFGPIRVRDNPRVMAMLAPYQRYPVLVG